MAKRINEFHSIQDLMKDVIKDNNLIATINIEDQLKSSVNDVIEEIT
jgi:hypothetical protein